MPRRRNLGAVLRLTAHTMDYRLYFFKDGHIVKAVDIQASNDTEAVSLAEPQREGRAELWQRGRVVKAFGEEQGRRSG